MVIEGQAAVWLEIATRRLTRLIRIADFADTAHGDLSAQRIVLADMPVNQFVQRDATKGFVVECHLADPIASSIGLLKGLEKVIGLFRRRKEAYYSN